jgi:chromosomal replication initiation ATPase DnaA
MKNPWLTSKAIARLVAKELTLPYEDVVSEKRHSHFSEARQIAMYLARKISFRTNLMIAQVFNRDPSTVSYCIRNVTKLMETDAVLRQKVELIEKKILRAFNEDSTNVPNPTLSAQ